MANDDITMWINKLQEKDNRAVEVIWNQYAERLMRAAKQKLRGMPLRAQDEEDVALSAFNSFLGQVEKNKNLKLDDRDDLWKFLVTITARKAWRAKRKNMAAKRGGGGVRGESVFHKAGDFEQDGINQVLGEAPTPEFALQVTEEMTLLLDKLDDETLKEIAQRKLEGYTNDEIAVQINRTTRTVERKLEAIRRLWSSAE